MEYFGTSLTESGHYTWDLSGERMVGIGLLPKHTPFNPEELTNNLQIGEVAFYQSSKFTVIAICGSCRDKREGSKSVFWVNEAISKEMMIQRIKLNQKANQIINAMPFVVQF